MFREPRTSLSKVFIDRRVVVRESPIHGWGCFAAEDIDSHVLIESAPVVVCHRSTTEALFEINDCRHVLMDYPFAWKDGMIVFALGWAAVYNHQAENNCNWQQNYEYDTLEFITKRKILKDEEITVRYLPARLRGALWFVDEGDEDVSFRDAMEAKNYGSKKASGIDWKNL